MRDGESGIRGEQDIIFPQQQYQAVFGDRGAVYQFFHTRRIDIHPKER